MTTMEPTAPFTIVVNVEMPRTYEFRHVKARVGREYVPLQVPVERAALRAGDYTIRGCEHAVAVVSKSLPELFLSVGTNRHLFEMELERLAEIPAAHLVCEFTFQDIFDGPSDSRVSRRSAVGSLLAWQSRYGLPPWFAGSRTAAEYLTYELLARWWKDATEFTDGLPGWIRRREERRFRRDFAPERALQRVIAEREQAKQAQQVPFKVDVVGDGGNHFG